MGESMPLGCQVWDNRERYANPEDIPQGMLRWGWSYRRDGWPDSHGQTCTRETAHSLVRLAAKAHRETQLRLANQVAKLLKSKGFTSPRKWHAQFVSEAMSMAMQKLHLTKAQAKDFTYNMGYMV